MPNQEAVNDQAKLIIHRLIARQLRNDADMVARARARLDDIERRSGEVDWVDMWRKLLEADLKEIRRRLVARDETSFWLRLSSPFSTVSGLPLENVELRRRIWRDAKRLATMSEQRRGSMTHGIEPGSYAVGP